MAKDILIATVYTTIILSTIVFVFLVLNFLNLNTESPTSIFSSNTSERVDTAVSDISSSGHTTEPDTETLIYENSDNTLSYSEKYETEKDPKQELKEIQLIIEQSIILDAENVQQCRLLPMGNSECGGPSFYYVYSVLGDNEVDLLELSKAHRTIDRSLKQENQIMAICMMSPEPMVIIREGKCSILSSQ
jgi:hypothetical protein